MGNPHYQRPLQEDTVEDSVTLHITPILPEVPEFGHVRSCRGGREREREIYTYIYIHIHMYI